MTIDQMKKSCEIFSRSGLGSEFLEAGHDIIHGVCMDLVREKISAEDIAILKDLGWNDSDDHFSCYV